MHTKNTYHGQVAAEVVLHQVQEGAVRAYLVCCCLQGYDQQAQPHVDHNISVVSVQGVCQ